MENYRVKLDVYNGPLDLLLYLIRRDELDIHDIPIARITSQYIEYVQVLKDVDPDLAGEFMVLAATLLEIKTRMLLPSPPPEEEVEDSLGLDPRSELVRQLLEYKAFKDAAGELGASAEAQAMKFPRQPVLPEGDSRELDLEDAQVWDLLDAFGKLMDAIGQRPTHHQVIYDDTPIELHTADLLDRINREGPLSFDRIFQGGLARVEIVGLFLALLELVRQKKVRARQDSNFGDIYIELRPAEENEAGEWETAAPGSAAAATAPAATAPADQEGTYAPETHRPDDNTEGDDDDDDTGPDHAIGV
jgi:segregation and condensation protein A